MRPKTVDLDRIPNMRAEISHLDYWDNVKLEFNIGVPYRTNFMVSLTEQDIDELIEMLQEAKEEAFREKGGDK